MRQAFAASAVSRVLIMMEPNIFARLSSFVARRARRSSTCDPHRTSNDAAPGSVREVAWLAYPAVLQTLSDTVMQVVDSAIVGRVGVTELGAVGFGGVWMWTLTVVFFGTGTGVQTFVAQAFGAKQFKECGRWTWQAFYTVMPLAALWAVAIALGFEAFVSFLGPSPQLRDLATSYALGRVAGVPAVVAGALFTGFFRGRGDTKTPLLGTLAANLVNVLLAYGLVYGKLGLPQLGVAGAGVAIGAANWTYAAVLLAAFLQPRMRERFETAPCWPDLRAMLRFARTSFPVGGHWLLDMITFALFSTIIARMGDTQMAASQAMVQLLSLSFMQAYGISIASGALVGRYVGAKDFVAAERSHYSALKLGVGLAAVVATLFVAVPELLLSIFSTDEGVHALGRPLLVIAALFQLIDAMQIICGGSLRGAGDTKWPFLVSASLAWFLRLPLVYGCAITLQGGVVGAWIGELGFIFVLSICNFFRFRNGAWRSMRI